MKYLFSIAFSVLIVLYLPAQTITADMKRDVFFSTDKYELRAPTQLKMKGFNEGELEKILQNSTISFTDAGTNKSISVKLSDLAAEVVKSEGKTTIKELIQINEDDGTHVQFDLNPKDDLGKMKDSAILQIKSTDGKKQHSAKIGKPDANGENGKKGNVNQISSLPASTLCSMPASPTFITKEMLAQSKNDFPFSLKNCFTQKRKRKLPGEYLLLYDYRRGDYYPLKKKFGKKTDLLDKEEQNACDGEYVEYYKLKSSMFFSPPAGSQLKVELMNYNDTLPLNLDVTYRDNFLEAEQSFQTTLNAFQQGGTKATTDTSGEDIEQQNFSEKQINSLKSLLAKLNQELCHYNSNFLYNSLTSDLHQQNVEVIMQRIRDIFKVSDDDLVKGIRILFEDVADVQGDVRRFEFLFKRLNNFQSIVYTAFRVRNRDNIILQFKNDRGRVLKEEELRISNGLKVDFSTGVFLTGLKDEAFKFKDTTLTYIARGDSILRDTSGSFIRREYSSRRKIGFGILAHVYPRLSSNYNLGISTGFSVNTETEINLLAGLSLMLGSERRMVISGGFIWGKANRLSRTVYEGLNRKDATIATSAPVFYTASDNVVPVVNDWQRSWFLGVSYNFSAR